MIYTDELSRLKPLLWTLAACLGFWALTIWQFPSWTFIILASITGVGLSFALGDWINRRIRRRREDFEIMDTLRREKLQDEMNEQAEARRDAGYRP